MNLRGIRITVALKYFRSGCNSSIIGNEYNILRSLSHGNIIEMVSFFPKWNVLALEYCSIVFEDNELHNIEEWSKTYKTRCAAVDCCLFQQILCGLDYLHSKEKLHCDMKPSNCLIKGRVTQPTIKLADFGLAFNQSIMATSTKHSSIGKSEIGTLLYKAPEACNPTGDWRTEENDIYAFGISVVEIIFPERASAYGTSLSDVGNIMGIFSLKLQGTLPPLSEPPKYWELSMWEKLSEIIKQCLSFTKSERPKANHLHQLVSDIASNCKESVNPDSGDQTSKDMSQDTLSQTSYMQSDFNLSLPDEVTHEPVNETEKLKECYQLEVS